MDEIEPMVNGSMADWSGEVGEISIYISGPETDRPNQGKVRPRNIIPENESESHLFPVRGMKRLWHLCPTKLHRGRERERELASRMSGKPAKPDRVVSLLRMDVFQHGMNPSAYSPIR